MLDPHFVILGAAFNLVGSISYLVDTIKGTTRPNRISWALWSLAPLIAFGAELSEGVGLSSLMTFMTGFGPLLIFTASFINRKSVWKLTRFDVTCGILSLIGLSLWAITRRGDVAIVFSIAADALAAIPTIVKSYKEPESENWIGFFFSAISAVITLFTIKVWTFANVGFPIYILIICIVFTLLIRFKLGTVSSSKYNLRDTK
jgi:hypothetical protein